MDIETNKAGTQENSITQGTGSGVGAIVYPERLELRSKLQSQNTISVDLTQVTSVRVSGLINCALTVETNDDRLLNIEGMALPDARQIKAAIERQKGVAGLWE